MDKHPAEFFIRYLLVKDPDTTDASMMKQLDNWGMLQPSQNYWGFLRQRVLEEMPDMFDPANRYHRESMTFLRRQEIYELFYPSSSIHEAWSTLSDPMKRSMVEQALMNHLDPKLIAQKLNRRYGWFLTEDGVSAFSHYFWNVKLLTFDEWGRFLASRTAMYDRLQALYNGPPSLAFFHLRLEQTIESKRMIQRVQEIAYHTVEEIATKSGTGPDKVKAIGILAKVVTECHNALSTSDMALKDVLQQFERFRMENPSQHPPSINELAPEGNFSRSGADEKIDTETN